MFVKVYRYKINTENLPRWQAIQDEALNVYRKYGDPGKVLRVKKPGKYVTEVVELNFYDSRDQFRKIYEEVNKDELLDQLFKEFFSLILQEKITEEEFETLSSTFEI